jgi:hypothetical protein
MLFCLILWPGLSLESNTISEIWVLSLVVYSIDTHNIDQLAVIVKLLPATRQRVQLELIHDQLPLAVPCYDLVLVIELTVGRHKDELRVLPTPLT